MLTESQIIEMHVLSEDAQPLTEEQMAEAVTRIDSLLEDVGLVVEAEQLDAYIDGVVEVLETYELPEETRAELHEILAKILAGAGKVAKFGARAAGQAVGLAKRGIAAGHKVAGAVKQTGEMLKGMGRQVAGAYRQGQVDAGGSVAQQSLKGKDYRAIARQQGAGAVRSLTKKVLGGMEGGRRSGAVQAKRDARQAAKLPAPAAAPAADTSAAPTVRAAKPKTPAQAAARERRIVRRAERRSAAPTVIAGGSTAAGGPKPGTLRALGQAAKAQG